MDACSIRGKLEAYLRLQGADDASEPIETKVFTHYVRD